MTTTLITTAGPDPESTAADRFGRPVPARPRDVSAPPSSTPMPRPSRLPDRWEQL
jgi:hypothetical protein